MTTPIWLDVSIVLLLLVISAYFSASETALTATSRARIHELARRGNRRATMVAELTTMRERLIGTILLGNNVVNIAASALATSFLLRALGPAGVVYATFAMTLLVLIFGEVLPKTYALINSDRVALAVAPVLRLEQILPGAELVIEHLVAHFLGGGDLGLVAGEPHFEIADTAQRCAACDGIGRTGSEQGAASIWPSVTFRHNCMHE